MRAKYAHFAKIGKAMQTQDRIAAIRASMNLTEVQKENAYAQERSSRHICTVPAANSQEISELDELIF